MKPGPLLLLLWREQHPYGHVQTTLCFNTLTPQAKPLSLFETKEEQKA